MLTTIGEIRERLVKSYDPERIILFGSRATDDEAVDSDIDLLIPKETEERPADRRMRVEKILADRSVPLDIVVYTPEEMRSLFSIGSPFIEEIVETGKVLYLRKTTEGWAKDAEDELSAAMVLLDHEKYSAACFHAQQCMDGAVFLNSIYKGRYPTEEGPLPHGEPTKADTERAVETAKTFMEGLRGVLR